MGGKLLGNKVCKISSLIAMVLLIVWGLGTTTVKAEDKKLSVDDLVLPEVGNTTIDTSTIRLSGTRTVLEEAVSEEYLYDNAKWLDGDSLVTTFEDGKTYTLEIRFNYQVMYMNEKLPDDIAAYKVEGLDLFENVRIACENNQMTGVIRADYKLNRGIYLNNSLIHDGNLLECIKTNVDQNGDDYLSQKEIYETVSLDVSGKIIHSLNGIGVLSSLLELDCSKNMLKEIPTEELTSLIKLDCSDNLIGELDLSSNSFLRHLKCYKNTIKIMDVRNTKICENTASDVQIGKQNDNKTIIVYMTANQIDVFNSLVVHENNANLISVNPDQNKPIYKVEEYTHATAYEGLPNVVAENDSLHKDCDRDKKCDVCNGAMPGEDKCYIIDLPKPLDGGEAYAEKLVANGKDIAIAWITSGNDGGYIAYNPEFKSLMDERVGNWNMFQAMKPFTYFKKDYTYQLSLFVTNVSTSENYPICLNGELINGSYIPNVGVISYATTEDSNYTAKEHVHAFDQKVVSKRYQVSDATCESPAIYKVSCICGNASQTDTFEGGNALGHNWGDGVIALEPKEGVKGIRTFICKNDSTHTKKEDIDALPLKEEPKEETAKLTAGAVMKDNESNGNYVVVTNAKNEYELTLKGILALQSGEIGIPDYVKIGDKEVPVTKIADNAFKNNKKLTKITIGANIVSIGKNAFYGCSKLKTVSGGKNVTTIGDKAFYKATSLSKITLQSKVAKIGKSAFEGCKNLKTVTVKTTKLKANKVGSKAFKGIHKKATVKVPKSKLGAYKTLFKKKGVNASSQKIKK